MSNFAWVTLTTNDTYSLGALVLAHSLRRTGTAHQLAVLVTPTVSEAMRQKLKDVYNVVQEVNVLDSQDAANLALLARPELGVTFTKLHCWRLVQFEKCVFLDADTLVLQNCDELFEREELSAAPDVSWPDCFNSGVFVYKPSLDTFAKITEFAVQNGSFDGGDQGLLNSYFADWAQADNKKRLPFIYNVAAYASYCYLPAFKQFRDKIKILHFAGKLKPWLIQFNSENRTACTPTEYVHATDLIQLWWNIFCDNVHQQLTDNMPYWRSFLQWNFIESNTHNPLHQQHHYHQASGQPHHWADHHYHQHHDHHDHHHQEQPRHYDFGNVEEFRDPWEDYYENLAKQNEQNNNNNSGNDNDNQCHNDNASNNDNSNNNEPEQQVHVQAAPTDVWHESTPECPNPPASAANLCDNSDNSGNNADNSQHECQSTHTETACSAAATNEHLQQQQQQHQQQEQQHPHQQQQHDNSTNANAAMPTDNAANRDLNANESAHNNDNNYEVEIHNTTTANTARNEDYLDIINTDKQINDNPRCAIVEQQQNEQNTNSNVNANANANTKSNESGLAGALAQLRLGVQRTPEQEAYEQLMRRQCWESGQIDYSGKDSFDNIWRKITETLENKPAPSAPKEEDKSELLTSADIEDGKVEIDPVTKARTEYKVIDGGYEVRTTTPQPNGTLQTSVRTFWDPKPVTEEDLKREAANKKAIRARFGKEIRIDKTTTMLTRETDTGYEEVYTTINADGTRSTRTKTFFDSIPADMPFNAPSPADKKKKTLVKKSSVDSTDSTESRRVTQRKDQQSNYKQETTLEESRRVLQSTEITENNRTVRKNSLQEQNVKQITQSSGDNKDRKKKKTKSSIPPPPPDFIENDTTTVSSKRVPHGVEYTYSTKLESGQTITTSKTVYEEEEVEMTEEEIRAYKKTLKDAEKHKNVTTTKKLRSESGTKKIVPSENPGDVTTVETIKIEGGTEYHYTTVTAEGIVKKAVKTVYDPVPSQGGGSSDEEEIVEEYEEEIIEPGDKTVKTIETVKSLPKKFEEEVTVTHEKTEKKVKKSMMISH